MTTFYPPPYRRIERAASMDYQSLGHADEFIEIIDSLGRVWNSLKHPRDHLGRFIRTFSRVRVNMPGPAGSGAEPLKAAGRVVAQDPDGSQWIKVTGIDEAHNPYGLEKGDYLKTTPDQLEVQTVKANLKNRSQRGGSLQGQQLDEATRQVGRLRDLGMTKEADDLERALEIAVKKPEEYDDPRVMAEEKNEAINLLRGVGDAVMEARGEGFNEGDDYNQIKATLPKDEQRRLDLLDAIAKQMYTTRNQMGDGEIELENDQGKIGADDPLVRQNTAIAELRRDSNSGKRYFDLTGERPVEAHLTPTAPEQEARAKGRTEIEREEQAAAGEVLPDLAHMVSQPLRTGLSRAAGAGQAQQVAPYDRWTTDKNEDQVIVGSVVNFDAKTGQGARDAGWGIVSRIHTAKDGTQQAYVRQPDPEMTLGGTDSKGNPVPYKEIRVTTLNKGNPVRNNALELVPENQQIDLFKQLAESGLSDVNASIVHALSAEWGETLSGITVAKPDAKKINAAVRITDLLPVMERSRKDRNGEEIKLGDHVQSINGQPVQGVVSYISPNTKDTISLQTVDGQKVVRLSSNSVTKLHGPTSDIYPDAALFNQNNYIPTRDEAAEAADRMGSPVVAQVIRDGGDVTEIQAAMQTDADFQNALDGVDQARLDLIMALEAGQEPDPDVAQRYTDWMKLRSASGEIFREPTPEPEPPVLPSAPEGDPDGELPMDPANPKKKISPSGTTVQENDDGTTVVDGDTENPIQTSDTEAVNQAVAEADTAAEEGPAAPEETGPKPGIAETIVNGIEGMLTELPAAPDSAVMKRLRGSLDGLKQAIADQNGDAFVQHLQQMSQEVGRNKQKQMVESRLNQTLNRPGDRRGPLWQEMAARLNAGQDIFAPRGGGREEIKERPPEQQNETPEGVDQAVDEADADIAEAALDGSLYVERDGTQVDEGYIVMDPETVSDYDEKPNRDEIGDFLADTESSPADGVHVWQDDNGGWHMARVSVHDDEQEAAEAAKVAQSFQFANIADGTVHNVTMGDADTPVEAVEDPRSEERTVRTAGSGKAQAARTTPKQKRTLDHVAGVEGADEGIKKITEAVKNGEEISGADASRLADYIDGLDVSQFEKPSDKGVASQMAHKLARAAGEEGARGYSSQATALRRTSDVGITLSALTRSDEVRALVDDARLDVKDGDMQSAAEKFRQAADAYDALGLPNDAPSRRAREHADRLDAMGGVTGPAPERVAEPAPATPEGEAPAPPEGETVPEANPELSTREALDAAGLTEVEPLTREGFSNPDTPRTREVTPQEYTALALRGQNRLEGMMDGGSAHVLEGNTWDEVKQQSWDSVQEEWGGITIDAHTGQAVTGEEDAYAVTFRPPGVETVSVPIGSSQEDFDAAMEQALQTFGGDEDSPLWTQQAHLGVFRNDDTGNYEIDPVLVFDNLDDVEAVGAYSGSNGGAYNFKDGLGYWPPYVAEGAPSGGAEEGQGVPGARGLEGPGEEGGEAEPGVPEGEGEAPAPAGVGAEAVNDPSVWFIPGGIVWDALGTADSYLESERLAEGDNGPQGWTDAIDEMNGGITNIRRRGEAGDYIENPAELAKDLRDLAQEFEDNFRLTDPSDAADELRELAERIEGVGAGEEEGAA